MSMRCWFCVVLAVLWASGTAMAQENPKPEQLKKMYNDALIGLKEAQDRKNQLAKENEDLVKQVAQLKKQLAAANAQLDAMNRDAAAFAQRTFNLRSFKAAWEDFIDRYPHLKVRWKLFLQSDRLDFPPDVPGLGNQDWPLPPES